MKGRTITRALAVGLLAVVTAAGLVSPVWAVQYSIQKPQNLYGTLNQNLIPGGGQFMCGPTAAVNSFVYLENAYPLVYNRNLVPDNNPPNGAHDPAELIATAQLLAAANYMNTMVALGASGTYDDMFIYGKYRYLEDNAAGQTVYSAELKSTWGWGVGVRPPAQIPPIPKPAWVQQNTIPTWQFLFNELTACEDVEILIVDGDWGHYLTLTSFFWNDANNNGIIEQAEGASIDYIDPATGAPGISPIGHAIGGGPQLFVSYGMYPNAQVVMAVSESPIPEPATLSLLAFGGLLTLTRRKR